MSSGSSVRGPPSSTGACAWRSPSGCKTTLVRHRLPAFAYANLESPDVRAFASEDPRGFLADHGEPLTTDEIQRVPALLSYLQERLDAAPGSGRFVPSEFAHHLKPCGYRIE